MRSPLIQAILLVYATALLPAALAATLELRYRAADYSFNAGGTAVWTDSSGNSGRNATQATAGNKPTLAAGATPGGQSALAFTGDSANYVNLPDLTAIAALAAGGEVFAVLKANADPPGPAGRTGLWYLGTNANNSHYVWTDGAIYDSFGSNNRNTVGNPTPPLTQFNILDISSQTNEWIARLNGTILFTNLSNTVAWPTTPRFGTGTSLGQYNFDGQLAELRIYGGVLTPSERATAMADLTALYFPEPASLVLLAAAALLPCRRRARR